MLKEIEKLKEITLTLLTGNDREQFILDNQCAFKYGAMEEFGERDSHFEEDGEIISRKTIENSIDQGVGGLVLQINEKTHHNHLDLLFVSPNAHSKGIGTAAWKCVESLYPETKAWETCTPYFEKRKTMKKKPHNYADFWTSTSF